MNGNSEYNVNEQGSFTLQVCAARSTNIGGLAASGGRSITAKVMFLVCC